MQGAFFGIQMKDTYYTKERAIVAINAQMKVIMPLSPRQTLKRNPLNQILEQALS